MPNTSLGFTATPANANLDTLPQLPGLLGALPATVVAALVAFNVVPVVASAAARDALIPVPVVNMRVQRSDSGFQERYDGAGWRQEGVLRSAGPVIATSSQAGFVGDGVNDDGVALAAADAKAVASGGRQELDLVAAPTKIFVNSNVTLVAPFRVNPGSKRIYIAAGKTLTILHCEAGDYGIFDPTSPGTLVLTTGQVVNGMWSGVVGSNAVNEVPALNFIATSVADYGILEFPGAIVGRLDSSWIISGRRGVTVRSRAGVHPDGGNATQFTWNGGAGGSMIKLSSCDHCTIDGLYVNMGSRGAGNYATVGVEINDTGTNGVTGTHCRVQRCLIKGSQMPAGVTYDCVFIGTAGGNNQEYHIVTENGFFGSDGQTVYGPSQGAYATIGAGTLGVASVSSVNLTIGRVYRFQCAGAGPGGVGLDTTLTATSAFGGTLAVAATNAVAGTFCLLGTFEGRGVHVGNSSNSKAHFISHNYFIHLIRGIWQENGSTFSFKNNFSGCCANIELSGGSEPFEDHFSNSEQSWQHCLMTVNGNGGQPVRFQSCRFGNLYTPASKGYFEFIGGGGVAVSDCSFDDPPHEAGRGTGATGSTAYNFANFSGTFRGTGNTYSNGWTVQEVGYVGTNGRQVHADGCVINYNEPGFTSPAQTAYLGGTFLVSKRDGAPAATFEAWTGGSGLPGNKLVAARSRGVRGASGNIGDTVVAHQATIGMDAGGRFDDHYLLFDADFGTLTTDGNQAVEIVGFNCSPPNYSGGGAQPVTGLKIPALDTNPGSLGVTKGIQQLGANDQNLLTALTTFGSGRVEHATVYIDIAAAGNATPNPAGAQHYRYRIAGAATINVPLNPVDGMEFEMEIFNNTAGAITPTLNAIFLGTGYGAIGAGKSRTRRWIYDGNLTKWKPVGAVSEDF